MLLGQAKNEDKKSCKKEKEGKKKKMKKTACMKNQGQKELGEGARKVKQHHHHQASNMICKAKGGKRDSKKEFSING